MQTTEKIWFNGKLVPWHEATVHVLSHALHYGGSAFEGIRFYNTQEGPAIFRLADHVTRLLYSVNSLKMPLPYTAEDISQAIQDVVRTNQLTEGYVRPIAFYGYGKMGVSPKGSPADLAIACWPWGAYLPHEQLKVKTSKYIRIHRNSTIVDAKLGGHYLNGILASLELEGTPYHEALFLDDQGYISEGVGENFFMVKDKVLYTPTLGTILAGITRDTVIQLANDQGLKVVQKNLSLEEAYTADEAFFTGTAAEVTPIYSINDRVLGKTYAGPVSSAIKSSYLAAVKGEDAQYKAYLTVVKA